MAGEQPTCGRGLAENAALPAKLGEVAAAMGAILDAHLPSLDLTDSHSRTEHEVYRHLSVDLHQAASQLAAIARQMRSARDLPMGRHDAAAMASPAVRRSLERFVEAEQELCRMLEQRSEQDRQMLTAM